MKVFFKYSCIGVFLILLNSPMAFSQSTTKIFGHIIDAHTGEELVGATIWVDEPLNDGTSTDINGYYEMALPSDSVEVTFSFVGYQKIVKKVKVSENTSFDIKLISENKSLDEIVIQANVLQERINNTQLGVERITIEEAKQIPALLGEVDIIKALQLKPGIQSGGEGNGGLYIRGGSPDQNLFLMDGAMIYNASHLLGLFSTFNSSAVKDLKLFKGGYPAQYGGRLSSILDINMRKGNKDKFSASGGIGLISSRVSLEGPIKKEKSSFIVSARRTYFNVFTNEINNANTDKDVYTPIPDYYFYDINGNLSFQLNDKDELNISSYAGNDFFNYSDKNFDFNFNWGNRVSSVNWKRKVSTKLSMTSSLTHSHYRYNITNILGGMEFDINSRINDFGANLHLDYAINDNHFIQLGGNFTQHHFNIGRLQVYEKEETPEFDAQTIHTASQFAAYVSDDMVLNDKLSVYTGIRLSGFHNSEETYGGIEPRMTAKYSLSPNTSIKAGYSKMYQYIHLLTNSGASLPMDIWHPSTGDIKPQVSHQLSGGFKTKLTDGLLLSNEVYFRHLDNQIDFKDGTQVFLNDNVANDLVFGTGTTYGNEFYIEKSKGNTTGWIGYTLSWSWRHFDEINNGEKFLAIQDRRHDLSLVINQKVSERVSISGTWVYGTGNLVSLPQGRFLLWNPEGSSAQMIPTFQKRNTYRMAPYHRMDLGLVWKFLPKWGESDLTFSIYNVYNRRNPYFIYFKEIPDEKNVLEKIEAKQVSLFPIIPSVSYNFKF